MGSSSACPTTIGYMLIGVFFAVLLLSGIPGGGGSSALLPASASSASTPAPLTPPLTGWTMLSNNLREGTTFGLELVGPPGNASWILLSSDTASPVFIAGLPTGLSADWFILGDLAWAPADGRRSLDVPIPSATGLVGLGLVAQCAVYDPAQASLSFSEPVPLRMGALGPPSLRIALIRQATLLSDAPFAPAVAQDFQGHMNFIGAQVDVFDDFLPDRGTLAHYDVLIDLRFTTPPSETEKETIAAFLRHQGGVLLVHGPFMLSSWSYLRHDWVRTLIQNTLQIPVPFLDGGNSSGMIPQHVDPGLDPNYLNLPYGIASQPLPVEWEGASFGIMGTQTAGSPWAVDSSGPAPKVYGMLFEPTDMGVATKGRLAVLLTGSRLSFEWGPQNPQAPMIFSNLALWLDR